MFRIRKEQMDVFSDEHRLKFEEGLAQHLRVACPERVALMTDDELRAQIRIGMAKAASYGITTASRVASFTQILVEEGQDFDTDPPSPWVREILADPNLDEESKVDHLWAYLDGYEKEDLERDLGDDAEEEDEPQQDDEDEDEPIDDDEEDEDEDEGDA